MLELGSTYETGRDNLRIDFPMAAYWYARAASLGSSAGHYALGAMTINGHRPGTPEEATALIERGAHGFVPDAEAAYGLALMTGRGVGPNEKEAVYWLGRAALHGSAWGTYLLAKAYRLGKGVPPDDEAGKALLVEAERLGYQPK